MSKLTLVAIATNTDFNPVFAHLSLVFRLVCLCWWSITFLAAVRKLILFILSRFILTSHCLMVVVRKLRRSLLLHLTVSFHIHWALLVIILILMLSWRRLIVRGKVELCKLTRVWEVQLWPGCLCLWMRSGILHPIGVGNISERLSFAVDCRIWLIIMGSVAAHH